MKREILLLTSLLEENLFQRLALVFQGLVVYWQATIWVEKGAIYETLLTISLVWITIFGLLAIYSLIDKTFKTLHAANRSSIFCYENDYSKYKTYFWNNCNLFI